MQFVVKGATLKQKEERKEKRIGTSSENTADLPATAQSFGDAVVNFDQCGDIYLWRIYFLPVVN